MFDTALLQAVAAVAATGAFDRAARRLGITPSAVSQRVKLLEERMGTTLILRGQPCRPTPAGSRLCRHVEEMALLEHGLRADLGALAPGGALPTVRIAVNADSLATWFVEALAGVSDRLFDLVIDDEDHTAEWLRRGEVSAAVATAPGPIAGCSSRPLGALLYEATASPRFAERWFANGVDLASLALAPSLVFNGKDRLQDRWMERRFGAAPARPVHAIPSSHGFVDAALAGLGWGMNPRALVAEHLQAGRLVRLDDGEALAVPLFWHWSRAVEPALGSLTQAVRTAAAHRLEP